MLKINKKLLISSKENESIKSSEDKIEIAYKKNNKALFLVYINQENNTVRFVLKIQLATSTEEMIFLLEKYRDFITRDITFGKSRLFDEIINYDDSTKKISNAIDMDVSVVEESLSYWNDIQRLEENLNDKFTFNMPLSDIETEKIEILKNSFLYDRMTMIGNLKNVCMISTDPQKLKDSKGKTENLVLIINNPKETVCGINLGKFYKRIEYGPVKILGYETLEEFRGDNGNLLYKYLLDLKEQKDTKTEIRYFVDQESAKEYKNEG